MVDSQEEYSRFLSILDNDVLLFLITEGDGHPVTETPSVLFVQNPLNKEIFHISFNHQDSPKVVDREQFINDFNKSIGRKFTIDKKLLIEVLPLKNVIDLNLVNFLKNGEVINYSDYLTTAHLLIRRNCSLHSKINDVIPLLKHKESVNLMFEKCSSLIKSTILSEEYFKRISGDVIEILAETERNGLKVNSKYKEFFQSTVYPNDMVYTQYNIYTSTGRPSNRFDGVNYAALKKDDGSRNCFISRFGEDGKLVLVDYSAFHPRIICQLTNFKISYNTDIYQYLAEKMFNKPIVDYHDIEDVKVLTFRQLYGGVEQEYSHIKYFSNLKSFIESNWDEFIENSYVRTPIFGRKITKKQILDANPNKLFNYILQSTEMEISIPILGKLNDFFRNKVSKCILYTYDSILFDMHKDEYALLNDIVNIMNMNKTYPVKCYEGVTYGSLNRIL